MSHLSIHSLFYPNFLFMLSDEWIQLAYNLQYYYKQNVQEYVGFQTEKIINFFLGLRPVLQIWNNFNDICDFIFKRSILLCGLNSITRFENINNNRFECFPV